MPDVIEFKSFEDDGAPKVRRAKGVDPYSKQHICQHGKMTIDENTQLVTCGHCGLAMSAFTALMIIVRQWERMHYDTTEWQKMKDEQAKTAKAGDVKRIVKELQWIECPDEGFEPARTYWLKLVSLGYEPYAMYQRRGRSGQIVVIRAPEPHRGYIDAEFLIRSLERENAKTVPVMRELGKREVRL